MPQKNEGKDRMEVLQMSKEFNPVISFDVTSPDSSVKTGANNLKDDGNKEAEPRELEFPAGQS